jgi:hypothetical protein
MHGTFRQAHSAFHQIRLLTTIVPRLPAEPGRVQVQVQVQVPVPVPVLVQVQVPLARSTARSLLVRSK